MTGRYRDDAARPETLHHHHHQLALLTTSPTVHLTADLFHRHQYCSNLRWEAKQWAATGRTPGLHPPRNA